MLQEDIFPLQIIKPVVFGECLINGFFAMVIRKNQSLQVNELTIQICYL